MKRGVLTSILILAALSGRAADSGWPEKVRFGLVGNQYNKPYTSGAIGVLQDKGWLADELAKHGTKVEYTFFIATGPAINESIANNTLDVASYGDLPTIIGRAGGLKTVAVASSGRAQSIYIGVAADSSIKNLDDLKGKRVTFQKGTYSHLEFDRVIKDKGWSEKDFKIFNLLSADQQVALVSKDVDADVGSSTLLDLRNQGQVKIIYKTGTQDETRKYLGFGLLVAVEPFLRKYPEAVQLIVDQYIRANVYISDPKNLDYYFKLVSKTGTGSASAREDLGNEQVADRNNPLLGPKFLDQIQEAIDFTKQIGLIRKPFSVKDWVDTSFLDKAVKNYQLPAQWDPQ
jgi:sulfonate transport system substrate-binding protein